METRNHQEWRSRQSVNWTAIWQTALSVGGILFIMSGGSPWSTAGTMNAAMGRDLPWGFFPLLVLHFALAYAYSAALAFTVYRLRLGAAIFAGPAVGLALFAINHVIFNSLGIVMQSPEFRALLVHLSFGLFAAVAYKGASVRPPLIGNETEVRSATHKMLVAARKEDPEPLPASDLPAALPAEVPQH